MSLLAAATVPLAASDAGKGSPIGLFVVLLLVVATYLLYRSMSGHIRRLPERFPGYRSGEPDQAAGSAQQGVAAGPAEPEVAAAPEAAAESSRPAGEAGERTGPS